MRKRYFLALLLICLFISPAFCEPNIGKYIYSIFSENFNGVKIDLEKWTGQLDRPESPDYASADFAKHWPGTYGSGTKYVVSEMTYSASTAPKTGLDGNIYWNHDMYVLGASRSAWTMVCFVDATVSTQTATARNMSAYNGGTLEFWARCNSTNAYKLKVGFTIPGTNPVITNKVKLLGNTGFVADGQWHRVVIPLSDLYNDLTTIKAPFFAVLEGVTSLTSINIDFDGIIWRKASGGSFDVHLKNVSDNSPASEITWSSDSIGQKWLPAQQYLELDLDVLPSSSSPNTSWGIQIYTDNTSSSASPRYTGDMSTSMASGLVSSSDTTKMLPMAWRTTDKVLPYSGRYKIDPVLYPDDFDKTLIIKANDGGLYDGGSDDPGTASYHCWFIMKDKAMYAPFPPIDPDEHDYLKIWDSRGFHAAPGPVEYWGMAPGSMVNMKIAPKIYLAASFALATTPNTYQTNRIVIELFYE